MNRQRKKDKVMNEEIINDPVEDFCRKNNDKINLLAGMRILVVEDEVLNRYYLENLFRMCNFVIDTAKDGYQALLMVSKNKYDLILTNVEMPLLDGINTTKIISKRWMLNTPVVAFSAHVDNKIRDCAIDAGAKKYLLKPLKMGDLINCFIDILDVRKSIQTVQ